MNHPTQTPRRKNGGETMTTEIEGNDGPTKPLESDNLSADAFLQTLLGAGEGTEHQPEVEETEEETELEEVEETTEEEEETEETEADGVDLDLDNLTPEQIQAFAKKARSKALSRFGELTGKVKDLEAKLEQAKAKPVNPLESARKVESPRIAAISTIEDLRTEQEQAEAVEEWAQGILDESGASDPSDIITEFKGKEYTKTQIRQMRDTARAAIKRDIPARLAEIQSEGELVRQKEWYDAQAAELIPDIAKDDSPVSATYKALLGDENLQDAFRKVPKLSAYGGFILAHAARSIELLKAEQAKGKPKPATTAGTIPRPKAPANPSGVGAISGNPTTPKRKQVEHRQRQFEQSGSADDFAAYLAETL